MPLFVSYSFPEEEMKMDKKRTTDSDRMQVEEHFCQDHSRSRDHP